MKLGDATIAIRTSSHPSLHFAVATLFIGSLIAGVHMAKSIVRLDKLIYGGFLPFLNCPSSKCTISTTRTSPQSMVPGSGCCTPTQTHLCIKSEPETCIVIWRKTGTISISATILKRILCSTTLTGKYLVRWKMNCVALVWLSLSGSKKAKGIGRAAVAKMRHAYYLSSLQKAKQMTHSFHCIRSRRHEITTIKQTKLSLSPYDDKRFLLRYGIHSLPYGHKNLTKRTADYDCVSTNAKERNVKGRGRVYKQPQWSLLQLVGGFQTVHSCRQL